MIVATIEQQVVQAKDRIAAVQGELSPNVSKKEQLPFRLAVHVCDSLMKKDKVYYLTRDNCKLYATVETKDSTIRNAVLKLNISVANSKAKLEKTYAVEPLNKQQQLPVDSLPEGKYEFTVVVLYG